VTSLSLPPSSAATYGAEYAYYRNTGLAPRFSSAWWSARFYTRLLRRYLDGGRVLDHGCGMGNTLRVLEESFEAHGVDVSAYAVGEAQRNAPRSMVWAGDLESLGPTADGRYDAVVSKHVLEHMADPRAAVNRMARLLRPGGYLLMGVPNTRSLFRGLKGDQWIGVKDPTHCSVFPPDYWTAAAGDAGLRVLKTFSDGFWDVPYVPLVPPLIQLPIFGCLAILQVVTGRPFIPVPLGESFIMLARKPNGGGGKERP
jgi:SAM-dependent methyltransferase